MELSSKRCTEDNIKCSAACMQNFDRIWKAVFSQDYLKELLYFTIICYTPEKMRNFNIILLFILTISLWQLAFFLSFMSWKHFVVEIIQIFTNLKLYLYEK